MQAVVFLGVAPGLLFSLRGFAIPGGDPGEMVDRISFIWQFFLRAPLVVALNRTLWLGLRDWGWSPADTIALSSSIAGGCYFWALFHLSRDPRVWLVCLLSKSTFIFLGHIENYAWPFATSVGCLALLKAVEERRAPSGLMWSCAVLGAFFHPMTLMIWPALVWGLWPLDRHRMVEVAGAFLVVFAVYDFFLLFGNVFGFFQTTWIIPLFEADGRTARYTLFSLDHLAEKSWIFAWTPPLGLGLWIAFRRWLTRPWHQSLALAAGIALLWSVIWYPGQGRNDWDLFSWPAIFVNLAGGIAWAEWARVRRAERNEKSPEPETDSGDLETRSGDLA